MILSESEKNQIRELHKKRSLIKEQPNTLHCQKCLQLNPTSAAQSANCNCPTCPCHPDFDVQALPCNDCLSLFWTHQLKEDNCNCLGCPCGDPIVPVEFLPNDTSVFQFEVPETPQSPGDMWAPAVPKVARNPEGVDKTIYKK